MFKSLKVLSILLIVVLLLALAGCAQPEKAVDEPVVDEPTVVEPRELELKYATGFTITDLGDGNKLVTDGDEQEFLLVPAGQEVPKGYENATVINTPIDNILFASTTQVVKLRPLGVLDSVRGVTSDIDRWHIEEIRAGLEDGSITFVGSGHAPDFEKIQALNPDFAFVYTGAHPQTVLIEKLEELGIAYIVDNEYMEPTAFGRMEWIKFYGAFYNKLDEAVAFFDAAMQNVTELEAKVAGLEKPRVIWGGNPREGKVWVPNEGSWVGELIRRAGGDHVFSDLNPDESGSTPITMEEFFDRAVDADIFIYSSWPPHGAASIAGLVEMAPILADAKPIKDGQVWQFQPWWWQNIDRTDEVLEDLAFIFHPETFPAETVRHLWHMPAE